MKNIVSELTVRPNCGMTLNQKYLLGDPSELQVLYMQLVC